MANTVMMFDVLGYPPDDPRVAIARAAVEKLLVVKDDEIYCQPCLSPVWDTSLVCHALLEVGTPQAVEQSIAGLRWLKPLQILDVAGDWADRRPAVRPGGWAFQYANPHYPDLDDTAVVVMAMDRAAAHPAAAGRAISARPSPAGRSGLPDCRARTGAGVPSTPTTPIHYLNYIPFADHGALLDPPTADVTGALYRHAGAARRQGLRAGAFGAPSTICAGPRKRTEAGMAAGA